MYQFFEDNGYLILKGVISPERAAAHAEHLHVLREQFDDMPADEINSHLLQEDKEWYDIISDPALVDIAQHFLGENIAHFYSRYFAKKPRSGREVPWHQDGAYYTLNPIKLCTLWLSLTKSTPENGGLRVLPGSHKFQLHDIKPTDDESSILKRLMSTENIDFSGAVDLVTEPGDVVLIHPHILHSSSVNSSHDWRIGLAVRYIPTSVRITWEELYGEPWDCAYLLRGKGDNADINRYMPVPGSQTIEAHQDAG